MDAGKESRHTMNATVSGVVDQLHAHIDTTATSNRFDMDLKRSLEDLHQLQTAYQTTPYVSEIVNDIQFLLENLKQLQ
jgi:hypothetical protein